MKDNRNLRILLTQANFRTVINYFNVLKIENFIMSLQSF